MTYGYMIEKIMPEVQNGGTEPFLIYHDAEGGWHGDFTKNQYGENFEWVADAINADKAAFVACGLDFAGGSYPYVFDKVLCQRMRNEYHLITSYDMSAEHKKIYALLNFFEDNVTEFSSETLDFLIDYDRPLKALTGFCPFNMATGHEGWTFNEDLAPDAVDAIEQRVASIINTRKLALGETELDEAELNKQTQRDVQAAIESGELGGDTKRVIDGYTEKFSVALAGREVFLAVDDTQDVPYLVCTAKWDNAFGVTEYTEGAVTYDYIDAMRDFVDRVDTLLIGLKKERASFMTVQPTLTAADCVKGGLDADLKGKVVVIKPDVLSPEYRTANHQLKIVQGGFGASPNSRGNAVFCKDLYSDKETRFERYDIAGVIDPSKLPQWAKDKLALAEALKEKELRVAENKALKEYGSVIDSAIKSGVEGKSVPLTLELLDARFGKEKTDILLATVALTSLKDDGRISTGNRNWAMSMVEDTGNLKAIPVSSHPAYLDNLIMYARQRDSQEQNKSALTQNIKATDELPKKPSLLTDLDASIIEAAQLAEHKGANPAKKRGDLEVD
ncbi:hypothetical protein FACS1894219_02290 [Clostridia bacterium]|nr:hypothetical protein FACS1894219_02290 [Clostridia bacterium]